MTKPTMPEPVAIAYEGENGLPTLTSTVNGALSLRDGDTLITTTQAEVYAAAKARVALEQAIAICQAEGDEWGSDSVEIEKNYAHAARDRIRALIPKEQA